MAMKESDWKIFKQIKTKALERFYRQALDEFAAIIQDESLTARERYLSLYDHVMETDRRLITIFDTHSRSKAREQLWMIRDAGLVEDEDLEGLSEETLKSTRPFW